MLDHVISKVEDIDENDLPKKIVCLLKLKVRNWWVSYFVGDNGSVYKTDVYSIYLGRCRKGLIHWFCTMGVHHPNTLMHKDDIVPVRKKRVVVKKTKKVEPSEPAKTILDEPNGEFDSLVYCPPASNSSSYIASIVGVPEPPLKKLNTPEVMDLLAAFNSKMENKGLLRASDSLQVA